MSHDAPARSSSLIPRSPAREVWLVFARRKYDEPIYQVGTVTADTPEMAEVYARSIYDEHPWIEMVVLPRSAGRTVIAP
jgi:1,2-phenylacetyl-CoA epoxidase PaaB subunit